MVVESPGLSRKVALVTGGGRRVGAALCRALGQGGYDLAIHYHRSREGAQALAEEAEAVGRRTAVIGGDLSDPTACAAVIDETLAALGHLDLVVCSAANFERVPFEDVDAASFDRAMALNVRAPLLLAHQARRALAERQGNIVIVTCTSATRPYPNFVPYVVSKGAAKQLMRTLAVEMAPVRVNAVAPGTVIAPESYDEAQRQALAAKTLVGHLGCVEDIAEAVLYLAGARFVTGHELLVDGGVALAEHWSGE